MRSRARNTGVGLTAAATLCAVGLAAGPAVADHDYEGPASGSAGDTTIVVPVNDSAAGGTYFQPFTRAYAGATDEGTPVYVYVPQGTPLNGSAPTGVHSMDPAFDQNPDDEFEPCADAAAGDFALSQAQINYLGDELSNQIVHVDEQHFGPMDAADPSDPSSDSLVTLVYNIQDEAYYDCAVDTYTAGYFAPEFIDSMGMNVISIDSSDWANRVGSDPSSAPWSDGDAANDRPELYEGVIAHELEHLVMNYSDPGELSWVDEGLADVAAFLNGYDMTGSHLTYQQVFHRETSLTRWGGGLENYGASFSYFEYLWERAGGNGGSGAQALTPDLDYDARGGDLLIKKIFEEQANGMSGVQRAINSFNAATGGSLPTAKALFEDWAVTMYLDDEASNRWDLKNFDLGPASGGWTIDVANSEFWDDRGFYQGSQPDPKFTTSAKRPPSSALPFGVSYETFRNPGPRVRRRSRTRRRTAARSTAAAWPTSCSQGSGSEPWSVSSQNSLLARSIVQPPEAGPRSKFSRSQRLDASSSRFIVTAQSSNSASFSAGLPPVGRVEGVDGPLHTVHAVGLLLEGNYDTTGRRPGRRSPGRA